MATTCHEDPLCVYTFIAQGGILEECVSEQMVKYAITAEEDKHYPWGVQEFSKYALREQCSLNL